MGEAPESGVGEAPKGEVGTAQKRRKEAAPEIIRSALGREMEWPAALALAAMRWAAAFGWRTASLAAFAGASTGFAGALVVVEAYSSCSCLAKDLRHLTCGNQLQHKLGDGGHVSSQGGKREPATLVVWNENWYY